MIKAFISLAVFYFFIPGLAYTRSETRAHYATEATRLVPSKGTNKYVPVEKLSSDLIPEFGEGFSNNVTVQRESTAFLNCPVKNPGDRPVSYPLISWVRIRDWHILTNGLVRFTTDDRFNVLYKEGSFNWILQIKFAQDRDAGIYECQVSTSTGTISRRVTLNVIYPEAFIKGGEEYHVDEGSSISLTCVIESTPTPPQYIFWYHNDRMVNYDIERGVKVTTSSDSTRTESILTFANANKRDEGNYTCSPSNSAAATVQLFVTKSNRDFDAKSLKKVPLASGEACLMPSPTPRLLLQIGLVFGAVAYIKPS